MSKDLQSVVFADQIDIRFPFSGFVAQVFKKAGDVVKKGEWLATLETKQLQTELDKELADYEKIRARFEIFDKEHPTVTDDLVKFLKVIEQADLNSSVKSVELAKMRLDQTKLICPINGIVVSDGGCRPGLFATSASNAFTVLDTDSFRLRVELDTPLPEMTGTFTVNNIALMITQIIPVGKKFAIDFYPQAPMNLILGTEVTINVLN